MCPLTFEPETMGVVKKQKPVITPRELEVLHLINEGLTDDLIARELSISANTVRTHRQNLRMKLQTNKTTSMLRKAKELDIL